MNVCMLTFPCFGPQEVKAINELINKNLGQREDAAQAANKAEKVGEFFNIPLSPVMNLIHPWLYRCQNINREHFGYNVDWQFFHLDSLNYNIYGINGKYDWHIDAHKMGSAADIKLTCLLNLSEEPYEGGEFRCLNHKGKIVFDSGMGLMTNSLIAHKVTPVTKGKRITLTYWATGPLWK